MPIYRVTFQTEMLIDCENEGEAESLGYRNLPDEVGNGTSEVLRVEKIESPDQLRRGENISLPWRSGDRRDEPELMVGDILNSWPKIPRDEP